jgi:integrase
MGSRYSMTLKRDAKSGAWKDRIRLPEDVRREYQALYGPAWEEKFHKPAETPSDKAVAEHAAWAAKVKGRVAALRDSKGGKGVDLTQRQADALAGDWYRWFTSQQLDNPGSAERWSTLREIAWERVALAGDPETSEAAFDDPEVLHGIDIEAKASQFLTDSGVALTPAGRTSFLIAVAIQFFAATELLERRAGRDWTPDQHLDQLPPSVLSSLSPAMTTSPSPNGQRSAAVIGDRTSRPQLPSATALFQAYIKDKQPKPSTIHRWRSVFTALDIEDWRAPHWDAQQWLDGLVGTGTPPRKPITVRDIWLSAVRAVFGWAIRKRRKDTEGRLLVETNPFEGCSVTVPNKSITRETGKAFNDDEIKTILRASAALGNPTEPRRAAKRWVPWLCAYTGARVGELTQLRVQDIEMRACGPVLCITPDAGTVKTGKARWVPIHRHLVEMGLLDYATAVKARLGGQGPLFYRPPSRPSRNPNYRSPADRARERLAKWVRELGITDQTIQPNHAWRHTFRTRASRAGIEKRIRDEICGHAPGNVADRYEHPTVEDMAEALKRFPRYEVE